MMTTKSSGTADWALLLGGGAASNWITGTVVTSLKSSKLVLLASTFVFTAIMMSEASAEVACWINAKTGTAVPNSDLYPWYAPPNRLDPNHATTPSGPTVPGGDFVRGLDGSWSNSATGAAVPSSDLYPWYAPRNPLDPNHATTPSGPTVPGSDFVRVPCPPQTASTGLYIGGELVKNWGWARSTETRTATDIVTNQFTDRADPLGGGVIIGYKFAPWANNIVVSPFVSFDFLRAPVNHTFAGGSFLGTTANFMGTFGVKVGPQLDMGLWLYGIAGVSVLNETLNVNFLPVTSSANTTVPGATVGVGGAWQPSFLQSFGRPVSLFLEYQHTWWQSANFNTPAASPFFNYNFRREDDVVKFGFTVSLSAPMPATVPTYPVKATASK